MRPSRWVNSSHALVFAGDVAVFVYRFGLGIDILQILPIVDPNLRKHRRVFVFAQAGRDGEAAQHLQNLGSAKRVIELAFRQQFFVDLLFLGDSQAVGNLDH